MESLPLVDSHCHLDQPPLAGDLAAVLGRAASQGVEHIVVPAVGRSTWRCLDGLSAGPVALHRAYGIHPWCSREGLDPGSLAARLERGAVAVGEIGLDFKIDAVDRDLQISVFETQVALAVDLDLPVILHCRGAFNELADILERFTPRLRGVLHAFTRPPELARRFLRLGLHLGIGGAVTRPNARRTRATAAEIPLERILLETDAPSIGLDGVAPEDTEPRHIRDIAVALAALRDDDLGHIAEVTTANAVRLFGLDEATG